MRCKQCNAASRVQDTVHVGHTTFRRKRCKNGHRWHTQEIPWEGTIPARNKQKRSKKQKTCDLCAGPVIMPIRWKDAGGLAFIFCETECRDEWIQGDTKETKNIDENQTTTEN